MGPARRQADLEAARVPIISNKYALGEDLVVAGGATVPDYRAPTRHGWVDSAHDLYTLKN